MRIAMITGAAQNTGLAIAQRFVQEGYGVILTSRSAESAKEAAQGLMARFPSSQVWGIQLEMDSAESIARGFQEAAKIAPHLDVFVANAAHLGVDVDIFTATAQTFDAVMNINVRGTFFCCQEAVKLMGEGSAICLISSIHSKAACTGRTVYAASKGAINAMMRAMAVELAHLGIRVNALIAGAIHTVRWDGQTPEQTAARRSRYPSGREATGDEIAAGVYYLCGPESLTTTGTELTIDSGLGACALPYDKNWRSK